MLLAWLLLGVFALLGGMHAYWVAGGQWGRDAALPTRPAHPQGSGPRVKAFNPSPAATLTVALGLWLIALLVAMRAGLWGEAVTHFALKWLLAVLALGMLARAVGDFRLVGFFKQVTGSRFARLDTRLYSPLCLLLGAGLAWVAFAPWP
jgi:hypothetical protein